MGIRESKPLVKKGYLYSEIKNDLCSFDLVFFPPSKQVGMVVRSDILNTVPKDQVYLFYSSSRGIQLEELDSIVEEFDVKNENSIYYCKFISPSRENKETFRQVFSLYNNLQHPTYCGCFTAPRYSPIAFLMKVFIDLRILPASLTDPENITVNDLISQSNNVPRILYQDPVYITTLLHYEPILSTNVLLKKQALFTSYSQIYVSP